MLPISLRAVHGLNAATFQVSSLALLSIVNSRAGVPAEYLPAYGAVSFLPYSLRPIIAWISSRLLSCRGDAGRDENSNRHDKLLSPAFALECLAMAGSTLVPPGGVVPCFAMGFARGVAGAWSDFLLGMAVIEFSRARCRSSADGGTYEETVSVNTAQASTAKNVGMMAASVGTYLFLSWEADFSDWVVNALILATAAVYLLAMLVSLKYQFHVTKTLEGFDRYNAIDGEEGGVSSNAREGEPAGLSVAVPVVPDTTSTMDDPSDDGDSSIAKGQYRQKIMEVLTLVAFQLLLAVSALHKPIAAVSSQTTWVSIMAIAAVMLISAICLSYQYERQRRAASTTTTKDCSDVHPGEKMLSHRRLNLYFLLRYALPIASFLLYSYQYSVFESQPEFLQLLSVLKTAVGGLSTWCYEKFLSPRCHSGWPLIGLIATLDIIVGLVALLDVWVVRAVDDRVTDGKYVVDASLKWIVAACALTKYFFAELDYMPAQVLSTTNVRDDGGDVPSMHRGAESPESHNDDGDDEVELAEGASSRLNGGKNRSFLSLNDFNDEGSSGSSEASAQEGGAAHVGAPVLSAGIQYASFLSCIDFGAQIGDWISVPIVASLGISREDHWEGLGKFIVVCSLCRIARVAFLWLICPPVHFRKMRWGSS
ncbi:hypothetical protein ACHAWF_004976 [Thalassiosira exigua]